MTFSKDYVLCINQHVGEIAAQDMEQSLLRLIYYSSEDDCFYAGDGFIAVRYAINNRDIDGVDPPPYDIAIPVNLVSGLSDTITLFVDEDRDIIWVRPCKSDTIECATHCRCNQDQSNMLDRLRNAVSNGVDDCESPFSFAIDLSFFSRFESVMTNGRGIVRLDTSDPRSPIVISETVANGVVPSVGVVMPIQRGSHRPPIPVCKSTGGYKREVDEIREFLLELGYDVPDDDVASRVKELFSRLIHKRIGVENEKIRGDDE